MSAERPHSQAKTIHLFAYVQPTDPGMIGAKKGWVDTSLDPPVLKVRNSANDGWITVGAAGGGGDGNPFTLMFTANGNVVPLGNGLLMTRGVV